jgi:hypothetical protein
MQHRRYESKISIPVWRFHLQKSCPKPVCPRAMGVHICATNEARRDVPDAQYATKTNYFNILKNGRKDKAFFGPEKRNSRQRWILTKVPAKVAARRLLFVHKDGQSTD